MSLGTKIQAIRREKNITQSQIANALGVKRQSVSRWELDLVIPDSVKTAKLAEFLGVTTDYLLEGIDVPAHKKTKHERSVKETTSHQATTPTETTTLVGSTTDKATKNDPIPPVEKTVVEVTTSAEPIEENLVEVNLSTEPLETDLVEVSTSTEPIEENLVEVNLSTEPLETDLVEVSTSTEPIEENLVEVNLSTEPIETDLVEVSTSIEPIESELVEVSTSTEPIESELVDVNLSTEPLETDLVEVSTSAEPLETDLVEVSTSTEPVETNLVAVNISTEPIDAEKQPELTAELAIAESIEYAILASNNQAIEDKTNDTQPDALVNNNEKKDEQNTQEEVKFDANDTEQNTSSPVATEQETVDPRLKPNYENKESVNKFLVSLIGKTVSLSFYESDYPYDILDLRDVITILDVDNSYIKLSVYNKKKRTKQVQIIPLSEISSICIEEV